MESRRAPFKGRHKHIFHSSCENCLIRGDLWLNQDVPRKKKPKKFTATKAVKSMARAALGTPPPVQREEGIKRRKKPKHRPTLGKLLSESE